MLLLFVLTALLTRPEDFCNPSLAASEGFHYSSNGLTAGATGVRGHLTTNTVELVHSLEVVQ